MAATAGESTEVAAACKAREESNCDEDRPYGDHKGAYADCGDRGCGGGAFRAHSVHQPSAWDLTEEAGKRPDGQHKPDVGLVPFLGGRYTAMNGPKPV